MSISSPQTGGSRRPSTPPPAGAQKATPAPSKTPAASSPHTRGKSCGPHTPNWQRCQGDVSPAKIANEHAVHAMEHGAVWITYRPDLPKADVDKLAAKVRGNDFMLMSPSPNLDKPISLQAWGYQLKLDKADDPRIDQFIKALRQNATQEAGVVCSAGNYINTTGTTPHDLGKEASPAAS